MRLGETFSKPAAIVSCLPFSTDLPPPPQPSFYRYSGRLASDLSVEFDSSDRRGTGLPYAIVLGNGDVSSHHPSMQTLPTPHDNISDGLGDFKAIYVAGIGQGRT